MCYGPRVEQQLGRRDRKKAAMRTHIAGTALRLFLEHGYDAVGIRDIAEAADVAVSTLFVHFPSKEALVFDRDSSLEQRLVGAITGRRAGSSVLTALQRETQEIVRQYARPEAEPFWRLVDATPALRNYVATMWLRHEHSLAAAVAAAVGLDEPSIACRALARYVLGIYPLVRDAADPVAAADEAFALITDGWTASAPQ
jgi:AcrR family transcriptional regulator